MSPPHPPSNSLSLVPTFPTLSQPSLLFLPPSPHPFSVCDSQKRGEERREHVRSPEIPPGPGEQRGVVLLALRGAESRHQRPVPVPHLPRWPGHPGLSWPGAEQSG